MAFNDSGRLRPLPTPRAHGRYPFSLDAYPDRFWMNRAIGHIETIDLSMPFFFAASFWAPHPPHYIPAPYHGRHDPSAIILPERIGRWFPGQPESLRMQPCGVMGAGVTRDEYRGAWAAYFDHVSLVDDCLGRVIETIKGRGVWNDALVVFTSDHGDMLGSHGLWEKGCAYDEACRVPLLIKPPHGGAKGNRGGLVGHIDLAATFCDYAGIPPISGQVGRSLRPLIEGRSLQESVWRRELPIAHFGDSTREPGWRARVVDDGRGRLRKHITTSGDNGELYDLTADPWETRTLDREDI